jgi:hypothetical protein
MPSIRHINSAALTKYFVITPTTGTPFFSDATAS